MYTREPIVKVTIEHLKTVVEEMVERNAIITMEQLDQAIAAVDIKQEIDQAVRAAVRDVVQRAVNSAVYDLQDILAKKLRERLPREAHSILETMLKDLK